MALETPAQQAVRKVVIFGNSGAGKSTLAQQLARNEGLAHLDLDTLAWEPVAPPRRRDGLLSQTDIAAFVAQHPCWVIEGCYSDLLRQVLPLSTLVLFLNPGLEVCVQNCKLRPWEPHKYQSPAQQDANLPLLLDWVRAYETRDDEFSLRSHRELFESHAGPKRELIAPRAGDLAPGEPL
jgi:adenylate kinase family enzyme